MTENQLAYLQYEENVRSNTARETETNRSNLAREAETNRANLANETETKRANQAREFETNRANLVDEAERERSNRQREALERTNQELKARGIRIDQLKAKEQERHNEYEERLGTSSEIRDWIKAPSEVIKNMATGFNSLLGGLKFFGG